MFIINTNIMYKKVKESMVNLEDVVRERNKAYWLLEIGETGERPGKLAVNQLGNVNSYFVNLLEKNKLFVIFFKRGNVFS